MRRQPKGRSSKWMDRTSPALRRFLDDMDGYPVLSESETQELVTKAKEGDQKARDRIVECNCRLLVKVAREFALAVDVEDLIQEGYFGLNEAIDKYDPAKGVPFVNFAPWWIKTKMVGYIFHNNGTVRVPESAWLRSVKLSDLTDKFLLENMRMPLDTELADLAGCRVDSARAYLYAFDHPRQRLLFREDLVAADGPDGSTPLEEAVDRADMHEALYKCLDTLTPEQAAFMREYYGIGGPKVQVKELAKRAGTSAENIRQRRVRLERYLKDNCSGQLQPYTEM